MIVETVSYLRDLPQGMNETKDPAAESGQF